MPERISRDAYGLRLAEAAALRADCTRRQVGAVIVAEDGSVIATGYNGLSSGKPGCASAGACPRGQMAYPTAPPLAVGDLDTAYPDPHPHKSCGSSDPEGWGCTLGPHTTPWHVASTGPGSKVLAVWPVDATHPADTGYEATGCRAVHAEINAIIRAGRDRCVGATIYVTDEPCFHCSVVIEGAGIARVVTPASDAPFAARREEMARREAERDSAAAQPDPAVITALIDTAKRSESGPLDADGMAALTRAVERARLEIREADKRSAMAP
jgi:deoxycytidylate deaminase